MTAPEVSYEIRPREKLSGSQQTTVCPTIIGIKGSDLVNVHEWNRLQFEPDVAMATVASPSLATFRRKIADSE